MKPDWKDAPSWATHLAMDQDGDWYWYDSLPIIEFSGDIYWTPTGERAIKAGNTDTWKGSVDSRNQ